MEHPISLENLITHNTDAPNLATTVANLKQRIIEAGDKPEATVSEQLEILEQMAEFGFGQCLIVNGGITGFWTRYMVLYPKWREEKPAVAATLTPLNQWFLEKCPVVLATQERFTYFQKLLQENIQDGMTAGSIPCGMMDDLLTLDLSQMPNVKLVGMDLDNASLEGAKEAAKEFRLDKQASFIQLDAWQLNMQQTFDVMTSNGLNIYEPDDEKIVDLYKKIHSSLKPNGIFITSFLTPPPTLSEDSSWNLHHINPADLKLQKIIFFHILPVKFNAFRGEKLTFQQLEKAGFKNIQIKYDKAGMFPTVWCRA